MIRQFHALRKHEEGQALVLAAISMLILTLCVLATVNLTYAAKERIKLQNSADAAAYTTAAYQARALNFFAYSNRAMTVHYASQMNIMAVMSFMATSLLVATLLETVTAAVPYLGVIFKIIRIIIQVYYWILALEVMVLMPVIDGMNYMMGLMQTAVWAAMGTRLLSTASDEVQKYNPQYKVDPLANVLLNLTPAALGVNGVVNADPIPNLNRPSAIFDKDATLNRLMMTEIANSARSEWTAYGKSGPRPWIAFFIPRRFDLDLNLGFLEIAFGRSARTEWGSLQGGAGAGGVGGFLNGLTGGIFSPTEQIYSVDRFYLKIRVLSLQAEFDLDAVARADRAAFTNLINNIVSQITGSGSSKNSIYYKFTTKYPNVPWYLSWLKAIINAPLQAAVKSMTSKAKLPNVPLFHFGQMPYARFKPIAHVGPQGSRAGLFNQPPVVVMVTAPTSYLTSVGQPFMGHFGVQLGGLSSKDRAKDKDYSNSTRNKTASKRGFVDSVDFKPGDQPYAFMTPGFHAMSAAMAYYHRPGDWREPPNLFNPMWGAKLMPVGDYPTLQNNALFHTLFLQNLLAH
jgi:hypothetical protein